MHQDKRKHNAREPRAEANIPGNKTHVPDAERSRLPQGSLKDSGPRPVLRPTQNKTQARGGNQPEDHAGASQTDDDSERALDARWQAVVGLVLADPAAHARLLNTLSLLEHIGCRKIVKALHTQSLDRELLQHIAEEARHAHFFKTLAERVDAAACPTYAPHCLLGGRTAQDYIQGLDHSTEAVLRDNAAETSAAEHEVIHPHAAAAHSAASAQAAENFGATSSAYNTSSGASAGNAAAHAARSEAEQRFNLHTYLCVTTLIEERATRIYARYEAAVRAAQLGFSLRGILAEESRHLDEMRERLTHAGVAWSRHAPLLRRLEQQLFVRWLAQTERELGLQPDADTEAGAIDDQGVGEAGPASMSRST